MFSMTPLVLVSTLLATRPRYALGATQACVSATPLALPITDIQVLPSISDSVMKGIPARIGTPPQDIVLLPGAELNNTYIYDQQSDCDASIIYSELICQIRRGGYFLETDSSTFEKSPDLISAGGATQEIATTGTGLGVKTLTGTSLSGTEGLAVGAAKALTLPIGIPRLRWDNGYTTLSPLGLGSNSTYLNALVQAGQIPSRVWSLFWGRMWTDVGVMDGHVVLGGYDEEKVVGANYTQPLDYSEATGCWTGMKATVSGLFVNFRNGTDVDVLPKNSAIRTCIVPHRQLLLEAPGSIVDDVETTMGMSNIGPSYSLHWSARNYNESFLDGDLTFQLSNGLQVRIPNSQFLTPAVDILRNGSRVLDMSIRQLLMNGVGEQPATLGRYFFTTAYLMVNHEAQSFTLWQANPSTSSKLVAVSKEATVDCADGEPNDGDKSNPGPASPSAESESKTNIGAIAGGVVGGVAALIIVVVAYFFFARRRSRGNVGGNKHPNELATVDHPSKKYSVGLHEVQGNDIYEHQGRRAEVDDPSTKYSVGPHEVQGNGIYEHQDRRAELEAGPETAVYRGY
ncbi:Aspartic peptidase domain containing protein [Rhypophila decipiens]